MSCTNCHTDRARRKGLCNACYQYAWRNGTPRPEANVIRHNVRRHEEDTIARRRRYHT